MPKRTIDEWLQDIDAAHPSQLGALLDPPLRTKAANLQWATRIPTEQGRDGLPGWMEKLAADRLWRTNPQPVVPAPADAVVSFVAGRADDDWLLAGFASTREGALVISELLVVANPIVGEDSEEKVLGTGSWPVERVYRPRRPDEIPARGITANVLREFRLAEIVFFLRLHLGELLEWRLQRDASLPISEAALSDEARENARAAAAAVTETSRPLPATPPEERQSSRRGPKGYGDDHWRDFAVRFLAVQRENGPIGVYDVLAEEFHAKPDTMRAWVKRASEGHWLSPASGQGKAGRQPGPRLLAELTDKRPPEGSFPLPAEPATQED